MVLITDDDDDNNNASDNDADDNDDDRWYIMIMNMMIMMITYTWDICNTCNINAGAAGSGVESRWVFQRRFVFHLS